MVPLLAYAALTAAMDVYGGNRLQLVSPAGLAAVSFTLAALFFCGLETWRRGPRWPAGLFRWRGDLIAVNITTAVTWLATFYALENLEPAVVNVIGLALGPVITVLAGPLLRRGSTVMRTEVAVSVGVCIVLGALVWGSFTGRSGLGDVPSDHALTGVVFSVVCAVGSAANIIYMKRLSDAGCADGAVLGVRFVLIIALGWVLVAVDDSADVSSALVPGAVVAVIGVGLPIYVLPVGIRHTEPITTSLLISLSPLFAFVMQFADGRLRPSALTLGSICAVIALVCLGTVARGRKEQQEMPEPVVAETVHRGDVALPPEREEAGP